MAGRSYSDEDRAKALAVLKANGGNVARTSREVGIPRGTLTSWKKDPDWAAPAETRAAAEAELEDLFQAEIRAAYALLGTKRPEATYNDLIRAIGILTDKTLLLTGRATEITASENIELRWPPAPKRREPVS